MKITNFLENELKNKFYLKHLFDKNLSLRTEFINLVNLEKKSAMDILNIYDIEEHIKELNKTIINFIKKHPHIDVKSLKKEIEDKEYYEK